MQPSFGPRIP